MDSGSAVIGYNTRSKQKLLKRQKENEGGDIICDLPESLISRILSSLPTKDAVRTSVLSKRWIRLWRSVTKLDLNDNDFVSPKKPRGRKRDFVSFVNFVNKALVLTKPSSLDSFSLAVGNCHKYDVSLVNTWIFSVLNRNLKKLHFYSYCMEIPFSSDTSHSLFNTRSLEELVLRMSFYSIATVPLRASYVQLENLKLLRLFQVKFTLDSSIHSKRLAFRFPVLQTLEVLDCTWLGVECVTFNVPLLKTIHISQGCVPHCCTMELSASHLTKFCYSGRFLRPITLLDPTSALNASANIILHIHEEDVVPQTELRVSQFLSQFSQVKNLSFHGLDILPQSRVPDLPEFGMLNHLELCLVRGGVLYGLLLQSPVLKTLVFWELSEFDKELLDFDIVPDCLRCTLQEVKFGRLHGHAQELCLAKLFMENGLVLKKISFDMSFYPVPRRGKSKAIEEIKQKVLSFKRGSSFAEVIFARMG